ncbi:MAG: hypothetical protein WDM89_20505 [Rhizomicrobium sp.]
MKLLKRVAESGAAPCMTFHVGSQCLSPFSYAQALEMARRTAAAACVEIQALDMGGGFPGPYLGNDVPPYQWYFGTIKEALATFGEKVPPVMCEPGRALIAEGVTLINQVILRKGDSLYMNDGVYGSFDELTLPGVDGGVCVARLFARRQEPRVAAGGRQESVSRLRADLRTRSTCCRGR